MQHTQQGKNQYLVPGAVVIAGLFIAAAIFFKGDASSAPIVDTAQAKQVAAATAGDLSKMTPVTAEDHIRGDINAPVKIVEYSDTECPFCNRFHTTMQNLIDESDGQVAWVYRHFPLDALHSKARKEAEATECAAAQGGNDMFWKYLDRLMAVTPMNNKLDPAELPKIAEYVGMDVEKFNECLSSGTYAQKVEDQAQNARAIGGTGTPWSIVVGPNGKMLPLKGAQPVASIKQMIDLVSQE
jgi:protein-disulfide isomerase